MSGASRRVSFADADRARIVRLYVEERMTMDLIAERFGVAASTIKSALLKAGVTLRTPSQGLGAAGPAAERRAELRRRWAAGETLQQIAEAFGTTPTAVYQAARKERLKRRA